MWIAFFINTMLFQLLALAPRIKANCSSVSCLFELKVKKVPFRKAIYKSNFWLINIFN